MPVTEIDFSSPDTVESLRAENERLRRHVAVNDEEYVTMKDVLRAEHQECQRLRAENTKLALECVRLRDGLRRSVALLDSISERVEYDEDCYIVIKDAQRLAEIAELRKLVP